MLYKLLLGTYKLIFLGFIALIVIGGLLLWLPISTTEGTDKLQGYKIYDFTTSGNLDIKFQWGGLFGKTSPSAYYKGLLDSATETEDKLKIMNDANTTLNEMNTYFKYDESSFKGLTITATVVTDA